MRGDELADLIPQAGGRSGQPRGGNHRCGPGARCRAPAEHHRHSAAAQQRLLVHRDLEPLAVQQIAYLRHPGVDLVDLDRHLADLRPVAVGNPRQHVVLALLDVDLEQVDSRQALLGQELRDRLDLALDELGLEPVPHQLFELGAGVTPVGLEGEDHVALRLGVGVASGEDRDVRIVGERDGPRLASQGELPRLDVPGVQPGVQGQQPMDLRDRLEGVDLRPGTPQTDVQREHADVGADVEHHAPRAQVEAMLQVALVDEDLVVEE